MVQKIFVINFITSYTPIILTAFVYVPFGTLLVPYLDIFSVTAQRLSGSAALKTKPFQINPDRLTKQVIYFTTTAQVVNFLLETIVPYLKRKLSTTIEHASSEVTSTLIKTPSSPTSSPRGILKLYTLWPFRKLPKSEIAPPPNVILILYKPVRVHCRHEY